MKCGGTRYIRLRTQGFSIWGTRELPKSLSISIAWHHKKIRIVRNFGGSQILKMKCGGTRIDKIRNPCFTAHFSPTLSNSNNSKLDFFFLFRFWADIHKNQKSFKCRPKNLKSLLRSNHARSSKVETLDGALKRGKLLPTRKKW